MPNASLFQRRSALAALHCFALALCSGATLLSLCPAALAGQVRESDLAISSQVGKVRTEAEGQKTEARSIVHSVDIKRDAQTGDVNVSGKAGGVHTQAGGQNTNAASAVGGVNVGGK